MLKGLGCHGQGVSSTPAQYSCVNMRHRVTHGAALWSSQGYGKFFHRGLESRESSWKRAWVEVSRAFGEEVAEACNVLPSESTEVVRVGPSDFRGALEAREGGGSIARVAYAETFAWCVSLAVEYHWVGRARRGVLKPGRDLLQARRLSVGLAVHGQSEVHYKINHGFPPARSLCSGRGTDRAA